MVEVNSLLALKTKLRRFAILDAIIEPEWSYRYFSYNSEWDVDVEVASLRDGSGSEWFVWFGPTRTGYKVLSLDDGRMASIEKVREYAAGRFDAFLDEPAFGTDVSTAIWLHDGTNWETFGKPKVEWLIDLKQVESWDATHYQKWAEEYYDRTISKASVSAIFNSGYSQKTASRLNPGFDRKKLLDEFPFLTTV